ncbi:MAG TPA: hypothetical protein VGJ84_06315, partial [Polyangiaceae bacterium]
AFAQLLLCDVLVALTDQGTPRGTLIEIGIALGLGKPVVWVSGKNGEGRNIFDSDFRCVRAQPPIDGKTLLAAIERALERVRVAGSAEE